MCSVARVQDAPAKCPNCPRHACCANFGFRKVCHDCTKKAAIDAIKSTLTLRDTDENFCTCKKKGDCCFDFAGMPICGNQCSKADALEKAKRAMDIPTAAPKLTR